MGHLSFTDILDTSLKVSWKEPQEKNGILTGDRKDKPKALLRFLHHWCTGKGCDIALTAVHYFFQVSASPGRSLTGPIPGWPIICPTWHRSTRWQGSLRLLPTLFRLQPWPPKDRVSYLLPPYPQVFHQVSVWGNAQTLDLSIFSKFFFTCLF